MVVVMMMVPSALDNDRAMMVVMVMILHSLQLCLAAGGAFLIHCLKNDAGVRNWF